MSRLNSRNKSSRRSRNKNHSRTSSSKLSLLPWISGILISLGIILFLIISPEKLDPTTFCPKEPSGTTVLLIDVSDKLSISQEARLNNELLNISKTSETRKDPFLSKGELLVVYILNEEGEKPDLLFKMCHPGDLLNRTTIEKLSQGEIFAKKQWQEFELKMMDHINTKISSAGDMSSSPIYEALQYIRAKEFPPNDVISDNDMYRLMIWSDLIQNSTLENHFKNISDPKSFYKDNPIQFEGIDIELMFLISEKYQSAQNDELVYWWRSIFAQSKSKLSLNFQK